MEIPSDINIKIEGPYSQAIIEICKTIQMAMEGQPPNVKAELWTRYAEATKPLHELGMAIVNATITPLVKAIQT